MKRWLCSLALLLGVAQTVHAQLQSGSISGTITDEQGGVMPGVTITLRGVDVTAMFTTDATGQYRFLNLALGVLHGHGGAPRLRHDRA